MQHPSKSKMQKGYHYSMHNTYAVVSDIMQEKYTESDLVIGFVVVELRLTSTLLTVTATVIKNF